MNLSELQQIGERDMTQDEFNMQIVKLLRELVKVQNPRVHDELDLRGLVEQIDLQLPVRESHK